MALYAVTHLKFIDESGAYLGLTRLFSRAAPGQRVVAATPGHSGQHYSLNGRFVEFMPSTLLPLCAYFRVCCGRCAGLSFVDSTVLAVCHNRRFAQHKVFAERAARGKNSVGWFFGFTLHLGFNDRGEILSVTLTPGDVNDRTPVPQLVQKPVWQTVW